MDIRTTNVLYSAIYQIEAQKVLVDIEVACFPNLKNQEDRSRSYKKWHKIAYPVKKKNKSTKEMADELQRLFGK